MIETMRAEFAIHGPRPDIHVIQVRGVLDAVAGVRLLRLVEARLILIAAGRVPTRHLILDLSGVTATEPDGLENLRHAHQRASLHKIGLHVVGLDAGPELPLPARRMVDRLSRFPTLESAMDGIWSQERAHQARRPRDAHP